MLIDLCENVLVYYCDISEYYTNVPHSNNIIDEIHI